MEHLKTTKELQNSLFEQLEFLRSSCQLYDAGNSSEAIRMAVILRVLLSDPESGSRSRSQSLLTQLGLKDNINYYSISPIPDKRSIIFSSLIMAFTNGASSFMPNLSIPTIELNFKDWWNSFVSITDAAKLTRSLLIKSLADKDGGAHVDPSIKDDYAEATQNKGFAFQIKTAKSGEPIDVSGDEFVDFDEIRHFIYLRQFAHEVLCTFDLKIGLVKVFDYVSTITKISIQDRAQEIIKIQDEDEREIAIQELNSTYPNHTSLSIIKSNIYYATKKYNKAKIILEALIKAEPNNLYAHNNYAILHNFHFNDPQKAIHHYEIALRDDKHNIDSHRNYAILLAQSGQYYKSKTQFEYTLKLHPNYAPTHYGYAILLKDYLNNPEKGKHHYLRACELDAQHKTPQNDMAFGV
ncbi:hypothetical protein GO988_11275 [Hymenobacter sp. HMF4947]|uniref:Tetratricopeptide repeat protein n=1 Tax=Hymenobacter ginkgonis TaxID=2682976 RepID=A0A7K1TES5_9BACT|nr:hypothetical protein [Hymenobacter ginkgonis]MVN76905.1 hypothetical protein [Hymenobacter ginkgonis]